MLVSEEFPELSQELQDLLRKRGEGQLAEQVPDLNLLDRCHCGDNVCATIYTQLKPIKKYGPGHRSMDLDAETGMIILHVVESKIACIEILHRDDVRAKLVKLLP
jgi:hypothetical protein